jgi:hypothetical protein
MKGDVVPCVIASTIQPLVIVLDESFQSLISVGNSFLHGCARLTAIDLAPLSNVVSVGDGFLDDCAGLTAIDLAPLSNVTSVGSWRRL